MVTTLAVQFPLGRVHATPWDRNVNEAAVEWPPSPWRLLRALYATWRERAPDLDAHVVAGLLSALGEPPRYLLPGTREGSTRHYMPDVAQGTDLVIDAFLAVSRDEDLVITWDVDLDDRGRAALGALARLLPAIGRADSICEARLVDDGSEALDGDAWVRPAQPEEIASLRLLCPALPLDVPSLLARTSEVRAARRPQPPGSVWQRYTSAVSAREGTQPRTARTRSRPTVVRWALASAARPSVTATVAMTDVLRQAVQSIYGRRNGGNASQLLAGKDPEGRPLRGHRHAHYLALDEDTDGLVDTLLVWVPHGLDPSELAALVALERLWGRDYVADFRPGNLVLEAVGGIEALPPQLVGPSTSWASRTPYLPTRHRKRKEEILEFLASDVSREVDFRVDGSPHHGLVPPRAVAEVAALPRSPLEYRRHRIRQGPESASRAVAVRLVFPRPVQGPLVLGRLSHFGLGLFAADVDVASGE